MQKVILVFALVLAFASAAMAGPNQLTYQGRLTDVGGAPLGPDTVTVQFKIFPDTTAGAVATLDTTIIVNTDAQGVFTTVLDDVGSAIGSPDRYIELTVRGTTLSPRQPLTAAPYVANRPLMFSSNQSSTTIGSTPVDAQSLTINVPTAGRVMVTGQANFRNEAANTFIGVSIKRGSTTLASSWWDAGDVDGWFDQHQTFSTQTNVTAGSHTFTLTLDGSSAASASAGAVQLFVLFFPN